MDRGFPSKNIQTPKSPNLCGKMDTFLYKERRSPRRS
jgi:hypothetical protein